MELKKNPEADLEKKKGFFFQIGLILALATILISFEWKVYDITVSELGKLKVEQEEEELIPITRQELTPPPPPPPKPTQIEIVEDKEEVKEEVVINTESTEETEIKIVEQVEEVVEEVPIFTIVEESASLPGCEKSKSEQERQMCTQDKILQHCGKHTKYPAMAKENGIQGTVYLNFEIDQNGNVKDIKILKGVGAGLDEEAIRVIKLLPKFYPAKQRGKAVRLSYTMPFKFVLR